MIHSCDFKYSSKIYISEFIYLTNRSELDAECLKLPFFGVNKMLYEVALSNSKAAMKNLYKYKNP